MIVSRLSNIDNVFYKSTKYKAVYIGNNEIWSRIAINFNNFLKYNYENWEFKFIEDPVYTVNHGPSEYDGHYGFDIVNIAPDIDRTIKYSYDQFNGYSSSNFTAKFYNPIITGNYDQSQVYNGTHFVDYTPARDLTALYDNHYGLDIPGILPDIDRTFYYSYDEFTKYDSGNFTAKFLNTIITGNYDQTQNYNSTNFVDYTPTRDLTAPYDSHYGLDINGMIPDIDRTFYYSYDQFNKYDSSNFSAKFLGTIITGNYDQTQVYINTDFVDYTPARDLTAPYDSHYQLDIVSILPDIDRTVYYSYDDFKGYDGTNFVSEFIGDSIAFDQYFVYTVNNMTAHFN